MESQDWEAHYTIPPQLTEELFPGLSYEEALEDQQALYEAFKVMSVNASDISSTSTGQVGNNNHQSMSWEEYYLWQNIDVNAQLALDEEMAKLMQNLEDEDKDDNVSSIHEPAHSSTRSGNEEDVASTNVPASANSSAAGNAEDTQDDIDPDEMTYEELQNLGETIGSESKGLSEDDISSLPYFMYRSRSSYFSRKSNLQECAICYSCYEHKQYVTTLPCAHQYHSDCINKWLRVSKSCPICQAEVDVSNSLDK